LITNTFTEPSKEIPVIDNVDVCVVGGSSTGVFAAVRAAQMGMRVAIIEKQNAFGGAAASGLVHIWHSLWDTEKKLQIIGGLTALTIESLKRSNAVSCCEDTPEAAYKMNTEELKLVLDALVQENNIKPYLHTVYCTAVTDDNRIRAAIIENKDGRQAIAAKFFIDATGDGDVCRRAGVASYTFDSMQPPTMCAKLIMPDIPDFSRLIFEHHEEFGLQKDWGWGNSIPNTDCMRMWALTHVFHVNCASAEQLTYSELEGRRQIRAILELLRKYAPGGEHILLAALPSYIGIRETYHIRSMHQITGDELLYGHKFADAIGNGSYRVDIHHSKGSGITFKYLNGVSEVIEEIGQDSQNGRWREATMQDPTFYQIPYRALVPDTALENILFAGRMIDAQEEAFSALRVMVNTNQMGEAAGVAAALAVRGNLPAKNVDTDALRKCLSDFGAVIL
jgi:hypothetical protein